MSLFSWLKADDTNLYDESPAVVDVNSHVPSLHVVVRIKATGMAVALGSGYITDHFHGPYYVNITDIGDLEVWEVGADLDPVAYYPAGNFHSVATYSEVEWADMHPDEDERTHMDDDEWDELNHDVTDEEYEEATLGVDPLGPQPNGRYNAAYLEELMNND